MNKKLAEREVIQVQWNGKISLWEGVISEALQWPPGKQTYLMISLIHWQKKKKVREVSQRPRFASHHQYREMLDYYSRGIEEPWSLAQ